jgi:hypothetical protein
MNMRLRPSSWRASRKPPNVSVYAFTTHESLACHRAHYAIVAPDVGDSAQSDLNSLGSAGISF